MSRKSQELEGKGELEAVALQLGLRADEKLHVVLQNIATLQVRLADARAALQAGSVQEEEALMPPA